MAIAIVISNIIMPAGAAFAATDHGSQPGTYQPVWCHLTGDGWKAQLGASPSGGRHDAFALIMTQGIFNQNLDNVDNTVSLGNQVMAHDRSDKLDADCATQFTVTPPAPVVTGVCGLNNDIVTVTNNSSL